MTTKAYVWFWLPGEMEPVVAGHIEARGDLYEFTYGQSYRARANAIALSPYELELQPGTFQPTGMHLLHSTLRDAAPDAWGRRVLCYKNSVTDLSEIEFLLLSGSDRIGALDFQASPTEYVPRNETHPSIEILMQATEWVEKRLPLPEELDYALLHGTSVGGARPKALIENNGQQYIAKFSSLTDSYDVVKAEYIAMRLARLCGIDVPDVQLESAMGKDVLLVQRFDRNYTEKGTLRRHMLSGLSILRLNEMEARYASYIDFADQVRKWFDKPEATLHELFRRMVFNVLIGNTDDHARNHAAFWDGKSLSLSPAYDICPQARAGGEATQAMDIGREGKLSTLTNVLSSCDAFQLTHDGAKSIIEEMIEVIESQWQSICDAADLGQAERGRIWGSAVFNPFAFQNWRDK